MTARGDDAASLFYNPAGIVQQPNVQIQLGFGVDWWRDSLNRADKESIRHDLSLPAMASIILHRDESRFAVAAGVESAPVLRETGLASAPGPVFQQLAPNFESTLRAFHSALGIAVSPRWRIGMDMRYVRGWIRDEYETVLDSGRNPNTFAVEGIRTATANVDGWSASVGMLFRDRAWGFGAVASSANLLNGTARIDVSTRNTGLPGRPSQRLSDSLAYLLNASRDLGADMPAEYRTGIWFAPLRKLRIEGDLSLTRWPQSDWQRPREVPLCGAACSTLLPRHWQDTVAVRMASEIEVRDRFQVFGGFGFDQSPARASVTFGTAPLDPSAGLRSYAGGFTHRFDRLAIDVGYSLQYRGGNRYLPDGHAASIANKLAISARWTSARDVTHRTMRGVVHIK